MATMDLTIARLQVKQAHAKKEYRPVVVALLVDVLGRTLFVQSAKNLTDWSPPQGGIDEGEELTEALFREIFEETGIEEDELGAPLFVDSEQLDAEPGRVDKRGFTRGKLYLAFVVPFKGDGEAAGLLLNPDEINDVRWAFPREFNEVLATTRREKRELTLSFLNRSNI